MNLIDRAVGRAIADSNAAAAAHANAHEIVVYRAPDSILWEVTLDGRFEGAYLLFDRAAGQALELVRKSGGKASVVYRDENSLTARARRAAEDDAAR